MEHVLYSEPITSTGQQKVAPNYMNNLSFSHVQRSPQRDLPYEVFGSILNYVDVFKAGHI